MTQDSLYKMSIPHEDGILESLFVSNPVLISAFFGEPVNLGTYGIVTLRVGYIRRVTNNPETIDMMRRLDLIPMGPSPIPRYIWLTKDMESRNRVVGRLKDRGYQGPELELIESFIPGTSES